MKIKSSVKASGPGLQVQHNQSQLAIKSSVKVCGPGLVLQHNQSHLAVKSSVKAGSFRFNHNQTGR